MPLVRLIAALKARGHSFTTITPASHARVLARPDRQAARDLVDVLGWSLPFGEGVVDRELLALLEEADALAPARDGMQRSRLRASTLGGDLYLHSAFPTDAPDSVFFGPDSYRFADLVAAEIGDARRIVDIGTGAGVGAIVAAKCCPGARVQATDVNPGALHLAAANAEAAGVRIEMVEDDRLDQVDGPIDCALANPPYIIDDSDRAYRDGGGMLGAQVSLEMARMAVERLAPGGRLILYTGSAIVRGHDALRKALAELGCAMQYREIDPDVFGEELAKPAYVEVDRIALVAAVLRK